MSVADGCTTADDDGDDSSDGDVMINNDKPLGERTKHSQAPSTKRYAKKSCV